MKQQFHPAALYSSRKACFRFTMFFLFIVLFSSCGDNARQKDEAKGSECLAKARVALAQDDYATARNAIDTLRAKYPLALKVREEAILTLDSIEIAAAGKDMNQDTISPDRKEEASVRHKFYLRKLDFDKRNFQKR
jgi:hypothetical protein